MSKNIIVLPGTKWQIPLVQKLKRRGFNVIVFDFYENQPAYKYADGYRLVDILDKERVLELAKEYNPVAVMSDECDIATPTIAWVSEQLGKPSIGMEMAELYTDKYKMREFSKENGLVAPAFYKCYTMETAIENFKAFGGKMIMKPLDGNSSRGVFSVECETDIITNFEQSIKYSKKEKCVLLEEYIEGEEFSIDGIMTEHGYYSMALAKKKHYEDNENLDQELIFKYKDEEYDYDLLRKTNQEYVEKTGLKFGLTHAEYKFQNGNFYLIEIGARGGGNLISGCINPNLTGIESQECLIDWATGYEIKEDHCTYIDNYREKCAILSFFDVGQQHGIITKIEGIEFLENEECIKSFYFDYKIGDTVRKVEDGGNRFGYYIACCDSLEELEQLKVKVTDTVKIVIE
ncbi:MAG: ATP-grasp domain-containing protein [Agathobacter sp.]|nr:ATP-grasp domain-containing protein [Agathobacter sp.]